MRPRVTPQQAWDALAEGNDRFMAGTLLHPQQSAQRRSELSGEQAPDAAFLGCSDSRVAAEILFDCGLGDLFVVRNIGQISNDNTTATMEFAVAELGVAVIVVLAHRSCGAVAAAIDQSGESPPEVTPAIRRELAHIQPAVQQEWLGVHRGTPYVEPGEIDADTVGQRHLVNTINALTRSSRVISDAVARGELGIVGCQYQLEEGRVEPVVTVGQLTTEAAAPARQAGAPVRGASLADDLLATDDARYAALLSGDLATLETVFDADFVYVHSTGREEGRASFIDSLRSGRVVYRDVDLRDRHVWVEGEVGVLRGRVVLDLVIREAPRPLDLAYLAVWRWVEGRWVMRSWAAAPVRET